MTCLVGGEKIHINRFLFKVQNFSRRFHRWKIENVQQQTNALFSRPFENKLLFHVRRESHNDPKTQKVRSFFDFSTQILKVFWKDFLIRSLKSFIKI